MTGETPPPHHDHGRPEHAGGAPSTLSNTFSVTGRDGKVRLGSSLGSGVIISDSGDIVTSAHTVAHATALSVTLADGTARQGRLTHVNEDEDLALLSVAPLQAWSPLTWVRSSAVGLGQEVLAAGTTDSDARLLSFTHGIISGSGRTATTETSRLAGLLLTDAPVTSGFSGGPLLDVNGRVVGLLTAVERSVNGSQVPGRAYAIPAQHVLQVLAGLQEASPAARQTPTLRVELRSDNGRPVVASAEKAPSDAQGLRVSDRLISVRGAPVPSVSAAADAIARLTPGTRVEVGFIRQGVAARAAVLVGNPDGPR